MAEEHTQQPSPRGKSRRERVEHARSRDILDVANELSMELFKSGRDYRWKEHDSMVISPEKNMWNWFSRHEGGDVISLVQTMKEVDFNQAIDFLNDGTFKEFTTVERVQEPFNYYLQPYEQSFEAARNYLKDQRGLSDETIDFFLEKGVLAQANAKVNGSIEPVVVFKSFDFSGEIVGATLQGIEENWEKWPERGYAKNIVRHSDGTTGMHIDIGQPNRLIFAESAIDLMSYYELNRDNLQDVRLVSMDGLKESVIGRHLAQLQSDISGRPLRWSHEQLAEGLQTAIDNHFFADGKHADWITLAVDNDEGGRNFINSLREKGAVVTEALPKLQPGQEKTDWNDALKKPTVDNSRLGQARRKLERLNSEFMEATESVYSHSAMANGQPMNDKRDGAAYFKKQDQLENKVSGILDEIKKQEERVERLEQQESFKQQGLNRKGNGLDMSVQNIPRIREELEKADRGAASYGKDTIKRYREELVRLEAIEAQMTSVTIQPGTQALIDEGLVNQWAKQPNLYFVKGLRRVAVELTEDGIFVESLKYRSKTEQEKSVLDELLAKQNVNPERLGYDKTHFALQDERGNALTSNFRYDLGTENDVVSSFLSQEFPEVYLALAKAADEPYQRRKPEVVEDHQAKVDKIISDITKDDTNYYLWHDEALSNLKAGDTIVEEFHNNLEDTHYQIAGATFYVEDSANDGATGYLSIEGHALDDNGIRDYLSEQGFSDIEKLEFLTKLQAELPEIWDKVLAHYDSELEKIISRYHLSSAEIEQKEKSLEETQGIMEDRASVGEGYLQLETEGSAKPVVETTTFEQTVTSHPTSPYRYLHFSTNFEEVQRRQSKYHPITPDDLKRMNQYSPSIQRAAQWYLGELSGSHIHYVYSDHGEMNILDVSFKQENFLHLTGIRPIDLGKQAADFVVDFAKGYGNYNQMLVSNNLKDKLQVLPMLEDILDPKSFVLDNLEEVRTAKRLNLSEAIKSKDEDFLLLFKDIGEERVPASLMKIKGDIKADLGKTDEKIILGVFRNRDGIIEILSVNDSFVKDGGQEMLSILENKQYEEALDVTSEVVQTDSLSAELFTQVLDAAYNVGDPRKLGNQVPEEMKAAWERYYELSDVHEENITAVIEAADQLGLIDKKSNFYQEWHQDRIYNENYHVRLQWSETWPDGPQIPFKETELVDYQTFAQELYKQNRAFYERHQESMATGNQADYIPFTKVKFDVYAPGGTLIKDNIRYDIGDETEPISRLLGLGYRRLEGQPELATIDDKVLSQLENQEVNQEIATEANEQSLKTQENLTDTTNNNREGFQSLNQEMKASLAKRVEEIMAEDVAKILASSVPQIQENLSVEGNLVGTPQTGNRMLYTNREYFGQDYQLELVVHSLSEIDNLSDTQAPWTLSLIKGGKQLGYLAYGSDWGNNFQIEEELKQLAEQISSGKTPGDLYKQEEVDVFFANNDGNESIQESSMPTVVDKPFDYTSASAYEISEHAFKKIREYTQSPEDLLEYMDFMSKFPQLSPRNVALIHEQWRGANAVATYDQWQAMGEVLGIKPEDVIQTKATYTNKRTGETKEVVHQGLSVKTGEKSQITLFRPLMVRMIPVFDETGQQLKNDKGNSKYKKLSEATPQEKALVKDGKLPVRQFQERDPKTGYPRFTTYKVFELSQTTLKPESYPKAMPNRHYNFNTDKVKTKEVLEGLCDYAESIGVTMMKDEAHVLGNAKGAFYPGEQLILINQDNTPGEKIATTIHELAHATLHNPKLADQYKELPKGQKELEAEMTSHLLSKHFGLDTSEKTIDYMASWTNNIKVLDDKQLADSLKRVHKTVSKMLKRVETHTKPYQVSKNRRQVPNFPKAPNKGPSR